MNKEIDYLSSLLSELTGLESEKKYTEVMNYMLTLMINRRYDLSPLAGKVIKLLPFPYPPLKKVVCTFLTRFSSKISDLNILATNSLLEDFTDPNPYVRKLVIKTSSSIPCLQDLAFRLIMQALNDNSPYVRSTAASSCSLIINESNFDSNQDIIDKLYEMIKDSESSVISSCLLSLDEILQFEGGIVINSRIAHYLMKRILEFQEWNFVILCMILKKYKPQNSDEALLFLNALDEKLSDKNPAVFSPALDLALHFVTEYHENLKKDILLQILGHFKYLLNDTNPEILMATLEIIENHLPQNSDIFVLFYKYFLCRFSDTTLIKCKKLDIMIHLITDKNSNEIIEEILLNLNNITKEVCKHAIHCFIKILKSNSQFFNHDHIDMFLQLMDNHYNNIHEEMFQALKNLDLDIISDFKESILNHISSHFPYKHISLEGKLALLQIIAKYGIHIENSPYIIEELFDEMDDFKNETLLMKLLNTSIKLFLVRPGEMQIILGRLLKFAENSNNILLKKQASIYYHLLKHPQIIQKILNINL